MLESVLEWPTLAPSRTILSSTDLWACNRRPPLHKRWPTLRRVGRLSVSNMFNILPPTKSPDRSRPTGVANENWATVHCSSGYGPSVKGFFFNFSSYF